MTGHQWTAWKYDRTRKRWFRHCVIGDRNCTATESRPRGSKA